MIQSKTRELEFTPVQGYLLALVFSFYQHPSEPHGFSERWRASKSGVIGLGSIVITRLRMQWRGKGWEIGRGRRPVERVIRAPISRMKKP